MQEIINAMLKIILSDGQYNHTVINAVHRSTEIYVEFHSGYTFRFDNEGYLTIDNSEKNIRERIRYATNAKLSPKILNILKDWLNTDFKSGIEIAEVKDNVKFGDEKNESNGEINDEKNENENELFDSNANQEPDSNQKDNPGKKIPSWADVKK